MMLELVDALAMELMAFALHLLSRPFPLLAVWDNKNGLSMPSMKVKKLKFFQNKMVLTGCKWSSLNAPGTETLLSHPFLKLGEFPFLIISLLG